MLLPAFVIHKCPTLSSSTSIPTGELNSDGKPNVLSKVWLSKLYLKISPLFPYEKTDIHTEFLLLSTAREPTVIYKGSIPLKVVLLSIGIGSSVIPSEVLFFICAM